MEKEKVYSVVKSVLILGALLSLLTIFAQPEVKGFFLELKDTILGGSETQSPVNLESGLCDRYLGAHPDCDGLEPDSEFCDKDCLPK